MCNTIRNLMNDILPQVLVNDIMYGEDPDSRKRIELSEAFCHDLRRKIKEDKARKYDEAMKVINN